MGDKKSSAVHEAADITRRMVCGGVAGMIAKVRHFPFVILCEYIQFVFDLLR